LPAFQGFDMATRRSKRAAGIQLSDDFAEIEGDAACKVYLDRRTEQVKKHAHVKCKFTIFDLVPELRSRI